MSKPATHHEWLVKLLALHISQPLETLAEALFDRDTMEGKSRWSKTDFEAPAPHGVLICGIDVGAPSPLGRFDEHIARIWDGVDRRFSIQVGDMFWSDDVPNQCLLHVLRVPPRQNYGVVWCPDDQCFVGARAALPPGCKIRINGWTIRELPQQ